MKADEGGERENLLRKQVNANAPSDGSEINRHNFPSAIRTAGDPIGQYYPIQWHPQRFPDAFGELNPIAQHGELELGLPRRVARKHRRSVSAGREPQLHQGKRHLQPKTSGGLKHTQYSTFRLVVKARQRQSVLPAPSELHISRSEGVIRKGT